MPQIQDHGYLYFNGSSYLSSCKGNWILFQFFKILFKERFKISPEKYQIGTNISLVIARSLVEVWRPLTCSSKPVQYT
jgi:hypothetical protein